MILSDDGIIRQLHLKHITISPIEENQIQPASVDLRLGRNLLTLDGEEIDIFDEPYLLQPNEFLLGSTLEYIELNHRRFVARVDGRSSIGRLGVMIHITAGYIDNGYCGNITLEIYNVSNKPFKLQYGDRVCQLVVELLETPCIRPYGTDGLGSKYQCSDGIVLSRLEEEHE